MLEALYHPKEMIDKSVTGKDQFGKFCGGEAPGANPVEFDCW